MEKIKKLELTPKQYAELENGFRNGESHSFRMRCRAVLLKGKGLSSVKAGQETEMSFVSVNAWVKRFFTECIEGLKTRPGRGRKPIMDCSDEQAVRLAIEQDRQSVSKAKEVWQQAAGKRASDITFKASQRSARMNIFGMINRKNNYKGFTTTDSITADKVVEFLDAFSFQVCKNTFVVLDNATVHRNHKVKELRPIWEKRGLFLFYLSPYSPHLNIAETLWRILKGKWIRPKDYASTDTLFYATNRILAAVGKSLFIKYSHTVA